MEDNEDQDEVLDYPDILWAHPEPELLRFHYFDPLTGCPPIFTGFQGQRVLNRARAILRNRTREELSAGLSAISWLLKQPNPFGRESEELLDVSDILSGAASLAVEPDIVEATKNEMPRFLSPGPYPSEVELLLVRRQQFDLSDYEEFSNAAWPELFAILALTFIERAFDDFHFYVLHAPENDIEGKQWLTQRGGGYLVRAMEALVTADGLEFGAWALEQGVRESAKAATEKRSLQMSIIAIKRHEKNNEAHQAFRDFYEGGKFKSLRNASQLFCERFPEKVSHLQEYNAVRTLTDGYRRLKTRERAKKESLSGTL